jgi:hypothetical protein
MAHEISSEIGVPRRVRDGLLLIVLFEIAVLVWGAALTSIESALGVALAIRRVPGSSGAGADALWHLASAALLALPSRRRALWIVAPVLALGLDIDHVFGVLVPGPFPRVAHNLVFLAIVGLILGFTRGRFAGLVAPGAILAHVAVDGGSFPLVAPFSPVSVSLPLWAQTVFLVAAVALFLAAARPLRDLYRPRYAIPAAAAVLVLVLLLAFVVPPNAGFNRV